jgi:hypothetical protein
VSEREIIETKNDITFSEHGSDNQGSSSPPPSQQILKL